MAFRFILAAMAALVQVLALPVARAQTFDLDWHTFDGGGGTSSGGGYSLSGTAGQPDAGTLSGGGHTLQGGFWGATALQQPVPPLLSIALTETNTVVVFWTVTPGNWRLDGATELKGTGAGWTEVPPPYPTEAGTAYYIETAPVTTRFYRLRSP